jgi:hypothetical protein
MSDHPVKLRAPDISAHRNGNTGIEFVHTFDSGQPGPHVCVNALMHGNEICGAIVLDRLLRAGIRPLRGRLTLCFVNVDAFHRFDPEEPVASRFVHEDMNRLWVAERLDGDEDSSELRRARLLRPLFDEVDFLLDIHSMSTLSEPILLNNGLPKERALSHKMGYPRTVACGSGHVLGRRLIEYAPFHEPDSHKTALLIECGQHWTEETVPVAMDTTMYFLDALQVLPERYSAQFIDCAEPPPQWMLDVTDGYTTRTDRFRFVSPFVGLERFESAGTVVAMDGDEPVVTPYDDCVLVMPHHVAARDRRVLRFAREHRAADA